MRIMVQVTKPGTLENELVEVVVQEDVVPGQAVSFTVEGVVKAVLPDD